MFVDESVLLLISDKLAGDCPGQKLSRPRRFTLGGAAVLFHSVYGTAGKTKQLFLMRLINYLALSSNVFELCRWDSHWRRLCSGKH